MTSLIEDRFILLSAGFSGLAGGPPVDSSEVARALRALLGAAFEVRARIVFADDPGITPLVLTMARHFGVKERIRIYQSQVFAPATSEAVRELCADGFARLIPVEPEFPERAGGDVRPIPERFPQSLRRVRSEMLRGGTAAMTDVVAGVFAGGGQGVVWDQSELRYRQGGARVYALGRPGGAARRISFEMRESESSPLHRELAVTGNYLTVIERVIRDIEARLAARAAGA